MLLTQGRVPIDIRQFPNGEMDFSHIQDDIRIIILKWESDADLFNLMQVKRTLDARGSKQIALTILYMPYSRMDRDAVGGSSCTLRYVGEFIQSLGFAKIRVMDPHSELTLAYLGEKSESIYPFTSFDESLFERQRPNPIIMFPDAGAQKRYSKMSLFAQLRQVVGYKNRDFATGRILGYDISAADCVRGNAVIIVDDLCSGGATFLFAARELRKFTPDSITLLVSHCEKTVARGDLLKAGSPIDRIVTTNSIIDDAWVEDWYSTRGGGTPANKFRILNVI